MPLIQSRAQLQAELRKIVREVIDEVTDRVLKDLQARIISDVYEAEYFPNKKYEAGHGGNPSWEFYKAWHWDDVTVLANEMFTKLWMHHDEMSWNKETIRHGIFADSTQNLDDILNLAYEGYNAGYTSGLMVGDEMKGTARPLSKWRRPYWKLFIEEMFDQGKLKQYFTDAFEKRGVTPT